jgi:kinesin family protein 11
LREDKETGIYIEGVNELIVENVYDCMNLLKKGERLRKVSQTRKNEMSSRSHTIFMISICKDKIDSNGNLKVNFNINSRKPG